jgi:hypothetical protein
VGCGEEEGLGMKIVTEPVRYRVSIVFPQTAAEFSAGRNTPKKVTFGIARIGSIENPYFSEVSVANATLDRCIELMRIKSTVVEVDEEMANKKGDWQTKVINAALLHILPDATN